MRAFDATARPFRGVDPQALLMRLREGTALVEVGSAKPRIGSKFTYHLNWFAEILS